MVFFTCLTLHVDSEAYLADPVMSVRFLSIGAATVNNTQAIDSNDILAAAIQKHPARFGGWATVE